MSLVIVDPGVLCLVQDGGRTGFEHLGVPRGGVLDRRAAGLANRLVGNRSGDAVLELTVSGGSFRCERALTFATAGSAAQVWVNGRHAAFGQAVWAPPGALVTIGRAIGGLRTYVAFRGGIEGPMVLGSQSTDTLAWIGPGPVREGQRLDVGPPAAEPPGVDAVPPRGWDGVLRIEPGPRWDWLSEEAQAELVTQTFRVAPDSDRIAMRLTGPPLERSRTGELPSEGIPDGGIQVPPSGQPLVFLADHPVTGGYPVVAVVMPDDLDWCAQLPPGTDVRFARSRSSWARSAGR